MAFHYRSITFNELPEPTRKAFLLAIGELPDWNDLPLILLAECGPEAAEYTRKSRVRGFCRYIEPCIIAVVAGQLSDMIKTLHHEHEHLTVHRIAFRPDQMGLASPLLESDADDAAIKGLKTFESKYPSTFQAGEVASIEWMEKNNFGDYNAEQINETDFLHELDEAIAAMKTINKS